MAIDGLSSQNQKSRRLSTQVLTWPFVRAPEGNGCAERFIRTLKENLLRVRTFETIEELQKALQEFKNDYNEHWLVQRVGHRSPNQFRRDDMDKIQAAA